MSRELKVRARDVVGRGGVGAIVEVGRQSFVTTDLAFWGAGRYEGQELDHPRLARRLNVSSLRSAKGSGEDGKAGPAFVRFPRWMFCERCNALKEYQPAQLGSREPECGECPRGASLIGIRWVGACSNGHLFDIPWRRWAHLNRMHKVVRDPNCQGRLGLRLTARRGAAEGSIVVTCRDCGAASTLMGLTGVGTLDAVGLPTCPGTQPWGEGHAAAHCGEQPHVLMRASSRLHFPRTISMLDLPPDADRKAAPEVQQQIRQALDVFTLELLKAKRRDGISIADELAFYAGRIGCDTADIEAFLDEDGRTRPAASSPTLGAVEDSDAEHTSLGDEWTALMMPRRKQPSWSRFVTEHLDPGDFGERLGPLFDRLVLVHRLREVRAYAGYRRITSDPSRGEFMWPSRSADARGLGVSWLPAHEVIGEGIFLDLAPSAVTTWLSAQVDAETRRRRDGVATQFSRSYLSAGASAVTMRQPEFVLLHTFAHLLIREMAYSAGYSSASLRERIYAGEDAGRRRMGILIYTAEGDSEGTLGGLVRLGAPQRLAGTIARLAERAAWCGQDPVCRESVGQGMHGLNLAACHGCSLVSETSCGHGNVLLDRNAIASGRAGAPGFLDVPAS